MVKVIVHIAKAMVAIVVSLLFASCGFDIRTVDGDGNVVKKEIPVTGNFNSVSVERDLEVIIVQGSQPSVTLETDQNLVEHIKIEVKGHELKITSDANLDSDMKRITVVMPTIESLSTSSSAKITANGAIKGDSMSFSSSSGSSIDLTIDADKLECETSSGSHIGVSGKTNDLDAQTSSGGHINAQALKAENVNATASSGGNIIVNPIKHLSADASSGGNIKYVTTPAKLKQNASSGGNVSQL